MNRLVLLLLTVHVCSPPGAFAADKNCSVQCEAQQEKCFKEAKTDKVKETCKTYFKGCLKSCSQGK